MTLDSPWLIPGQQVDRAMAVAPGIYAYASNT